MRIDTPLFRWDRVVARARAGFPMRVDVRNESVEKIVLWYHGGRCFRREQISRRRLPPRRPTLSRAVSPEMCPPRRAGGEQNERYSRDS